MALFLVRLWLSDKVAWLVVKVVLHNGLALDFRGGSVEIVIIRFESFTSN